MFWGQVSCWANGRWILAKNARPSLPICQPVVLSLKSGTDTEFSPCTTIFPVSYHSASSPHLFVYHSGWYSGLISYCRTQFHYRIAPRIKTRKGIWTKECVFLYRNSQHESWPACSKACKGAENFQDNPQVGSGLRTCLLESLFHNFRLPIRYLRT